MSARIYRYRNIYIYIYIYIIEKPSERTGGQRHAPHHGQGAQQYLVLYIFMKKKIKSKEGWVTCAVLPRGARRVEPQPLLEPLLLCPQTNVLLLHLKDVYLLCSVLAPSVPWLLYSHPSVHGSN